MLSAQVYSSEPRLTSCKSELTLVGEAVLRIGDLEDDRVARLRPREQTANCAPQVGADRMELLRNYAA